MVVDSYRIHTDSANEKKIVGDSKKWMAFWVICLI